MPSFQPGTRVEAKSITKKHLWQIAKVVQPDTPNLDPHTVTVRFVGSNDKVNLPSKHVRLAPERPSAPVVDLTDPTDDQHPQTSSGDHHATSLPSYPDQRGNNSQRHSTVHPSQSVQQPSPMPVFSDPWNDPPHPETRQPLNQEPRAAENTKESSRDWLLAQHSTDGHHSLTTAPSEPRFPAPQRQPQVVRDPSFSAPQYPAQSRTNRDSSSWDGLQHLSSGEEPHFSSQPRHEENFVRFAQKAQSFQFTPIRTDANMSSQPPPVPRDPSARGKTPVRPPIPRPFPTDARHPTSAAWTPAISPQINSHSPPARSQGSSNAGSSISHRNGLITRDHKRHPLRTVDEHLRIPRTVAAQKDLGAVPRHPQSSFDDDVPIPRNAKSPCFGNNAEVRDGADTEGGRWYPASKRQRLRYDMLARDQMPPSFEAQLTMGKLSRRLAKREKEQGGVQRQIQEDVISHSLAYQRPLQRENGIVRIAPNFDTSQVFWASSEGISHEEAKVLEDIFADLSVSTGDTALHNDYSLLPLRRNVSPLAVRGGGRKKSRPKKLRRSQYDKRPVARACFGTGGHSVQGDVAVSLRDHPVDGSLGEHENSDNCPMPRLYGCSCHDEREEHRFFCYEKYSIQCSMCMLWFHIACTGLEPEEIRTLRDGTSGKEKYICMQCVDEQVALGSDDKNPHHQVFQEGAKWISSVHSVSELVSGLSIAATDTLLYSKLRDDVCGRRCAWIREPLAQDEISARVSNLEQLREGVTNASVGTRERNLFDELLSGQRGKPEDSSD